MVGMQIGTIQDNAKSMMMIKDDDDDCDFDYDYEDDDKFYESDDFGFGDEKQLGNSELVFHTLNLTLSHLIVIITLIVILILLYYYLSY